MKKRKINHRDTKKRPRTARPRPARAGKNNEQLALVLESTTEGYWVWDLATGQVECGRELLSTLGYSAKGLPKDHNFWESIVHPDDLTRFESELRRHLSTAQRAFDCEARLHVRSGQYKWFRIRARVVERQSRTRPLRMIGIVMHIAKQVQRKVTESEATLRKPTEKFATAFRRAPVAISIISLRDHRYLEVNDLFAMSLGVHREDVIGKTPVDLNRWVDPGKWGAMAREVLENGSARNVECCFTSKGELRYAVAAAELIDVDDEPCMLSITDDVTDRRASEQALRDSEERLRLAFEVSRMSTFEWEAKSKGIKWSKGPLNELSDLKEQDFLQILHEEDRKKFTATVSGLTAERPDYRIELRIPQANGTNRWLEQSGRAFFGPNQELERVVGVVLEIPESRESERGLRDLSGHLINSQEEERRRIARELHDNVGQELALLAVQAERIDSGSSDAESTTRSEIHELYKRIKDLGGRVSNLSHRLHSSELEFLGLGVAVERLSREFSKHYQVEVDANIRALPNRIANPISLSLYRVTQEALHNVARHSQAKRVQLQLMGHDNRLELVIQDFGRGFSLGRIGCGSGLGLISMRERMKFIGGELTIASKPGEGTTIRATVTLRQSMSQAV